jgi:hypothetical protein
MAQSARVTDPGSGPSGRLCGSVREKTGEGGAVPGRPPIPVHRTKWGCYRLPPPKSPSAIRQAQGRALASLRTDLGTDECQARIVAEPIGGRQKSRFCNPLNPFMLARNFVYLP